MSGFYNANVGGLLTALAKPKRRKIFVSYHHSGDQAYYDEFSRVFHDQYEAVFDNSLERAYESDDVNYVMRRIRENHIHGTSCTVVLCGPQTRWRKYVDWEIKATLDKWHGIVALQLPTLPVGPEGKVHFPDRLFDNISSGYAVWMHWNQLNLPTLNQAIETAIGREKWRISNGREMRQRDG
jgi:hypothetical protein